MTDNLWGSTATFRQCAAEKISFVLLNQFDLGLTILAIYLGLAELNPFIRLLIHMPILLLIFKCAIPILIAWLIPGKLLLPAIALLSLVAIWNIKELFLCLL